MARYTKLTALQVDELQAAAVKLSASIDQVTAANAAAAAGTAPTKAEFDVVVTLANQLKTTVNAIVNALKG